MFYAFQMNNGRWQVDAYTSAPDSARALAFKAPSFDTRAQAEQWASDARKTWGDVKATAWLTQYREELTPEGIQLVIPGCEKTTDTKTPAQLALF